MVVVFDVLSGIRWREAQSSEAGKVVSTIRSERIGMRCMGMNDYPVVLRDLFRVLSSVLRRST